MKLQRYGTALSFLSTFIVACVPAATAGSNTQVNPPKPAAANQGAEVEFITVSELKARIAKNDPISIIDLRSANAYAGSYQKIKGALHVKPRKITMRLETLSRDREVVTYCACQADATSIRAARTLLDLGFKRVRVLKGGWNAWVEGGGQMESAPQAGKRAS